jgi:DNA-binding NtrC family response regulator
LREKTKKFQRRIVERTLRAHDGNLTAAAKKLGVSRPAFYDLLHRLAITRRSR